MRENSFMDPPWLKFPGIPVRSAAWRMGHGEVYILQWHDWYAQQEKETRQLYQLTYPEPEGWTGFYGGIRKQ